MTKTTGYIFALLSICLAFFCPLSAFGSAGFEKIVPGNWVEVRGRLDERGIFQASRVELVDPQGESLLTGTVSSSLGAGEFRLLGQAIQISNKTRYKGVGAQALLNARVKVEGHYRGPNRFSARKIKLRSPGRDRISGLISDIGRLDEGYTLTILNRKIHIPADVALIHDRPVVEYALATLNAAMPAGKQVAEDKQFGKGVRLSDRLRFTMLVDARYAAEDNYNLNKRKDRDREDLAASIRGRLVVAPSEAGVSGQVEVRHTRLEREDARAGQSGNDDTRFSESFIFLEDPFQAGVDLQAGRINFDDRREWLYDQDLDGFKAYWRLAGWLAELSATTTLSDGNEWEESTKNYAAYIANPNRNLAGYVIHRNTQLSGVNQNISHIGVRAFGGWPAGHESWLEVSGIYGSRDGTDLRGWGFDLGTTRFLGERWNVTAGWAFGQGDDDTRDGTDGNFRQTGLHDNNGKFGGVTSFRYYGELFDPELANLHIATLGLGFRFAPKGSVDLVGHYYRQDRAVARIIDSDLDKKPDGTHRELGWELDAIAGWRPTRAWDLELVVSWFEPGEAFLKNDDAWLGKVHIRYRY